jgi:flagellar biosynthetic protein FliR
MEISIANIIVPLVLIASRVSGLTLFAPVFSSPAIPSRIKVVVVIALTALLYPTLAGQLKTIQPMDVPLCMIREIVVGLGLGIAMNLVFDAVQFAGQMVSIQVGYSLVNIIDPTTQVDSTVMALFHQMMVTLIFLRLDVHLWIIRAIARSFQVVPPEQLALTGRFAAAVVNGAAGVFAIGLQIAAPVLVATIVADVALAMLGKASPQMQVMLFGNALKSLLGAAVLITALVYWPSLFERLFARSMDYTDKLLYLAHV